MRARDWSMAEASVKASASSCHAGLCGRGAVGVHSYRLSAALATSAVRLDVSTVRPRCGVRRRGLGHVGGELDDVLGACWLADEFAGRVGGGQLGEAAFAFSSPDRIFGVLLAAREDIAERIGVSTRKNR